MSSPYLSDKSNYVGISAPNYFGPVYCFCAGTCAVKSVFTGGFVRLGILFLSPEPILAPAFGEKILYTPLV